MSKTKELKIEGSAARIEPFRYGQSKISVTVEDPVIDELLVGIHTDDLIAYVSANMGPEEIFSTTELEKWAESEGYIKAETQND